MGSSKLAGASRSSSKGGKGTSALKARSIDSQNKRSNWPVYLYVPNLIGYARILANFVAFGVAFTNKTLFVVLYLLSFVCDELDGRFARMLDQKSTFGAVLDMVTDRVGTAALLVVLTHIYKSSFLVFLGLLALDISSHWLQMYSTFLGRKTSHKDMSDSKSWLLRVYYNHRIFMGYCCVGSEVLYILFYLLPNPTGNLMEAVEIAAKEKSLLFFLGLIAAPGCALKQWINLVQMKAAADITVQYDAERDNTQKVDVD